MGFTYNSAADPQTDLGTIRLLIGDTDSTAALFTDEEIGAIGDQRGGLTNHNLVAADLMDVLANRYAIQATTKVGDQSINLSDISKQYAARAKELRKRQGGARTVDTRRVDGYSDDVDSLDVATNPRNSFDNSGFERWDRLP